MSFCAFFVSIIWYCAIFLVILSRFIYWVLGNYQLFNLIIYLYETNLLVLF